MQSHHLADVVQNTVEAMGRLGHIGSPELAQALLRALQHSKSSVRNAAMAALVPAGTAEVIRQASALFDAFESRAQVDWVRAAARHLPADEVVQVFGPLIDRNRSGNLFRVLVEETAKLPAEYALQVFEPFWEQSSGAFRTAIASVMHASGDRRGTQFFIDQLRTGDVDAKVTALGAASVGGFDYMLDEVLRMSLSSEPPVRRAVIAGLVGVSGENVDNVLMSMTADGDPQVRMDAYSAMRVRGVSPPLDPLIDVVRNGSGTNLVHAMTDLSSSGNPEAIAAIRQRMAESPERERRMFLQALGRSRSEAGFEALESEFLAPEYAIDDRGKQTNVTYAAVLFPNRAESGPALVELFGELPKSDYRRRASILYALGNIAALTEDQQTKAAIYDTYRGVIRDPEEIPQMRILAMQYLERDLRIEDLQWLRALQETEEGPMRRMVVAYLYEYF